MKIIFPRPPTNYFGSSSYGDYLFCSMTIKPVKYILILVLRTPISVWFSNCIISWNFSILWQVFFMSDLLISLMLGQHFHLIYVSTVISTTLIIFNLFVVCSSFLPLWTTLSNVGHVSTQIFNVASDRDKLYFIAFIGSLGQITGDSLHGNMLWKW